MDSSEIFVSHALFALIHRSLTRGLGSHTHIFFPGNIVGEFLTVVVTLIFSYCYIFLKLRIKVVSANSHLAATNAQYKNIKKNFRVLPRYCSGGIESQMQYWITQSLSETVKEIVVWMIS